MVTIQRATTLCPAHCIARTHLVDVSVGSTEAADEDWGSAPHVLQSSWLASTLTLEEDVARADLGDGNLLDLELAGLLLAESSYSVAYLLVDERLHRAGRNSTLDHYLLLALTQTLRKLVGVTALR